MKISGKKEGHGGAAFEESGDNQKVSMPKGE